MFIRDIHYHIRPIGVHDREKVNAVTTVEYFVRGHVVVAVVVGNTLQSHACHVVKTIKLHLVKYSI